MWRQEFLSPFESKYFSLFHSNGDDLSKNGRELGLKTRVSGI